MSRSALGRLNSMGAQAFGTVLDSFTLDGDALRDLDAVVRERCRALDPELAPEYVVVRRDGCTYATTTVDDILRERNGKDTRVTSITLKVDDGDGLSFAVAFDGAVKLEASGTDRGKTILVAGDIRSFLRERLRRRGLVADATARQLRRWIPAVTGLVMFLAYLQVSVWDYNRRSAEHRRAIDAASARSDARFDQRQEKERAAAAALAVDGRAALASGTPKAKLDYLVRREVAIAEENARQRIEIVSDGDSVPDVDPPWYFDTPSLSFAIMPVAALLAAALLRWWLPAGAGIFLWGDEGRRQTRRERRRERVVWSIGVAFVVSVLAGIAVGVLL